MQQHADQPTDLARAGGLTVDHQLHNCNGGDRCDCQGYVCIGGLAYCDVCHGAEGSLTTACPGEPMTTEQQDDVYARRVDYQDGAWRKLGRPTAGGDRGPA